MKPNLASSHKLLGHLIVVIHYLLVPVRIAASRCGARDWEDPGCWEKLRKGMSPFEVLRLLGAPGKVSTYDGFERWEYPSALGARVNFDDRGVVVSWKPPRPGSETR